MSDRVVDKPSLYVAHAQMMERAIGRAIGPHGTFARWSSWTSDSPPTSPALNGYVLYGFGPSGHETTPGSVLWFVVSQTYQEPGDFIRVDAIPAPEDVAVIPGRFPSRHDQAMLEVWLVMGLGDALRAAFRRRVSA